MISPVAVLAGTPASGRPFDADDQVADLQTGALGRRRVEHAHDQQPPVRCGATSTPIPENCWPRSNDPYCCGVR